MGIIECIRLLSQIDTPSQNFNATIIKNPILSPILNWHIIWLIKPDNKI